MKLLRKCGALFCALILIFCAGCRQNNTVATAYYTFTDDSGKTVVLNKKPQRVAVLFSSFADIWVSAGGEVSITVGESVERGFAKSDAVLVDGGAGKTINCEALVSAEPDFVIGSLDIEAHKDAAETLKSAQIPSALFRVESFEDYLRVLKICTDITGDSDKYKQNGTEVKEKIDKQLNALEKGKDAPKVLFIRAGSSPSSTKVKNSKQHFAGWMLTQIGAENVADRAAVLVDTLSAEEIILINPDFIFISTMGKESEAKANIEAIFKQPQWQTLDAVKDGKYYFLPKDLFQYKPNSRWAEAYAFLIKKVYEN